jgi:hypothetical protein
MLRALGFFAAGPLIEDLIISRHSPDVRMHWTEMLRGSVQQEEQPEAAWLEQGAGMGSKGQSSDGAGCTKT